MVRPPLYGAVMPKYGEMRAQLQRAAEAAATLSRVTALDASLADQTKRELTRAKESQVLERLAQLPVEQMRDATEASLRIETLRRHGINTVASVYMTSADQLERISGISADGARLLKGVSNQMFSAVAQSLNYSARPDNLSDADIALLTSVQGLERLRARMGGHREKMTQVVDALNSSISKTEPLRSRIRWWFTNSEKREQAVRAMSDIALLLGEPSTAILLGAAADAMNRYSTSRPDPVVQDFQKRASDYYAVLESVTGTLAKVDQRFLDKDLLNRIESTELDTGLLNATLRRYQVFGSKFALTQNRVILGDEMGLGKTMQALGVLAQRSTEGARHFLVVCPASVLVNWQRELESRSGLPSVRIHGETLQSGISQWRSDGGVALTTFDTLKTFGLTDSEIAGIGLDTIVVDEAHYVKNSATGRAQTLMRWLEHAPRVLFMTGTPLENRVEEFVSLAAMLDTAFATQLNHAVLAVGSDAFREHVAPLYLRRNAEDVLTELPELIEVDEFCTWDGADYVSYVEAVAQGNFMAMRRAGMMPALQGGASSKMIRLLELVEEAFDSGQKVIVYSFFRDVISLVAGALGERSLEPITGETSPRKRQEIVDAFTASVEPLVLIGQIQAAGTGLNIQAASVVILCEPQIKPSLEVQAIARAHRMGQVRSVQVHRLIIPDGVDTLMMNMLQRKQEEFDTYARDSVLADSVSSAKDKSEEAMARVIVLEERKRLGVADAGQR